MQSNFQFRTTQEDFLARITDAAYRVVLGQGLQRSFVDVELELWQKIRQVFRNEVLTNSAIRPHLAAPATPLEEVA